MPTITEIISAEQSKNRLCIKLYSEGIFYKAYEHSAWLAYHVLNRYMLQSSHTASWPLSSTTANLEERHSMSSEY